MPKRVDVLPDFLSMRSLRSLTALPLALFCMIGAASAQRHDLGSSPPTAPPPKPLAVPQPIGPTAVSSGLGPLQFTTANYSISAPQALAVEMQSSDDRIRTSALAAIGAPGQYLNPGHVAFPHSVQLSFLDLGTTNELDAILTVELDQHLVSAILAPEDDQWHRVATILYPTAFSDAATTPSTFLRADRAFLDPQHYTAIFHATTNGPGGNFSENEARLRILNGHAVITISFASAERSCDPTHQKPCDITDRWLQPDATDPEHRFLLVSATGHVKLNEAGDPITQAETYEASRLRTFSCQPFMFSDVSLHFEPTSDATPCAVPHDVPHDQLHETPHKTPHDAQHDGGHDQPLH